MTVNPAARLEAISARFRVLSVPTRLAMLHALQRRELTVSELSAAVATSQPNVSKHLRVLVDAGFVGRREDGAATRCRILDPTVFRLCDLVCHGEWAKVGAPARLPRRRRKA